MKIASHTIKRLSITLILMIATNLFGQKGFSQLVTVTNPASPFTVPANVSSMKVEVWGAGGGGGGARNNGFFATSGGGGGGGGAYNFSIFTVSPTQTYSISIGAGGIAGTNTPTDGGTGGTTTVTGTGGTVNAAGGGGGHLGNNTNGAAGAAGTGGSFNGGAGGASSGNGAGGGGGAGNNGDGNLGTNTAAGTGGTGSPNVAPYIGGTGAGARTGDNTGLGGNAPGGGGGGGRATAGFFSAVTNAGGAGGAGQVVLTYCTTPLPTIANSTINYCQNTAASQLSATGTGLLWYSTLTGPPVGTATAPTPSTLNTGTTDYYVSQTVGGCEGPRAHIIVTVNPTPTTTVTGQSDLNCFAAADGTITIQANGGTSPYLYSVNNGVNYTPGATNPFTMTGLNANTVYKIRVKDNNGCESTLIP